MRAILFSVIALLVASQVQAEPVRFAGNVSIESPFWVCLQYREGDTEYIRQTATEYIDVSLDPTGPTSFYHQRNLTLGQPATITWTELGLVPGTFALVPITTTFTVDPFTAKNANYGPKNLVWGAGTTHFSEVIPWPYSGTGDLAPATLSGSYKVSGPTETKTGTFTFTFPSYLVSALQFDVASFPETVMVHATDASTYFRSSEPPAEAVPETVFDVTVDGVPRLLEIPYFGFGSGSSFEYPRTWQTLGAVPEPSTLIGLLSMGLAGLGFAWWQRKRSRAGHV